MVFACNIRVIQSILDQKTTSIKSVFGCFFEDTNLNRRTFFLKIDHQHRNCVLKKATRYIGLRYSHFIPKLHQFAFLCNVCMLVVGGYNHAINFSFSLPYTRHYNHDTDRLTVWHGTNVQVSSSRKLKIKLQQAT